MGSQAARTAEILRSRGYFVEKVEQVVAGTFIKRDCFGAFDYLAIRRGERGVLGVQVCASDRKADHVAKLRELEPVWVWLRSGNQIVVHSWTKSRERNPSTGNWTAPRWRVLESSITIDDLKPAPHWPTVRKAIRDRMAARKAESLRKRRETLASRRPTS